MHGNHNDKFVPVIPKSKTSLMQFYTADTHPVPLFIHELHINLFTKNRTLHVSIHDFPMVFSTFFSDLDKSRFGWTTTNAVGQLWVSLQIVSVHVIFYSAPQHLSYLNVQCCISETTKFYYVYYCIRATCFDYSRIIFRPF